MIKNTLNKDYNVIIGLYAGINWLTQIIDACRKQTILPKQILVWINKHDTFGAPNLDTLQQKYPDINIIWHNQNLGVYSRFSAAMLSYADRYLVLDDDTIPGPEWVENCYHTISQVGDESIIGYRGIRLKSDALYDVEAYEKGNDEIKEVDLVGHAWFCKKKHILAMFKDKPINNFNGEDTHLSAINQIKYGTKSYVPKQLVSEPSTWGSTKQHLGAQQGRLSTSLGPQEHFTQRKTVNEYWIARGWKPLFSRI